MWRYWLDFFIFPPLALFLFACDAFGWPGIGWWGVGALSWTLAEYWTHRVLLHLVFWHEAHERHHRRPREYVTAIWWQTLAFFAALYAVDQWLDAPHGLFAGFLAGYVAFILIHHLLHHADLNRAAWLRRYAVWHNRHHRLGNCNYGLTVPIWDFVFFTRATSPHHGAMQ